MAAGKQSNPETNKLTFIYLGNWIQGTLQEIEWEVAQFYNITVIVFLWFASWQLDKV